jgi:type I restriction enzyme S subunit
MREGWETVRLDDVCTFKPPKKEAKQKLGADDLVSFVPMSNLKIRMKPLELNEERALDKVAGSYTYFSNGDVLLAKITPCFENGKLGIANGLKNGVGFGSSEFIVMRPNEELDAEYLFYFLSQDSVRNAGARVMSGAVGHKRVPREFVEGLKLPLPSLIEQKRTVAILDEAFAGIYAAIANTEKNFANARELFESYLNSVFNQPVMKEATQKLPEVCENLDRKRIPITKSRRMPGDIPYYGATGVVDHVKDYIFDEDLLLVSEDGANLLARTYPIAFSISGKAWVNNHAHVMRFSSSESQRFVEYYLNSITLEPYVSGMAQPKLNQKALNSITIPVPSADEKRIIVDKLDEIVAGKDQLSKIYQQKLTALAELKQSLLQKAFSGELTADKAASDATLKEEACP